MAEPVGLAATAPAAAAKAGALPDDDKGQIRYQNAAGQEITLSWMIVRDFFLSTATKLQAYAFMGFCRAARLDPFLQECWLAEFEGRVQILVSKDAFLKRAERHKAYGGFRAGLVLLKVDPTAPDFPGEAEATVPPFVAIEGTIYPPGYQLVGSWCKVFRKDREDPIRVALPLEEYIAHKKDGAVTKIWNEKAGTMIRKCALAHGHREAFPDELAGWYFPEEFGRQDDGRREARNVTPPLPRPEVLGPSPEMAPMLAALDWTHGQFEMWSARRRELTPEQLVAALRAECVKAGVMLPAPAAPANGAPGAATRPVPPAPPPAPPAATAAVAPPGWDGLELDVAPPAVVMEADPLALVDPTDPVVQACLRALDWSVDDLRAQVAFHEIRTEQDLMLLLDVELEQRGIRLAPDVVKTAQHREPPPPKKPGRSVTVEIPAITPPGQLEL
jgi:phage recombination protein Bet